MHLNWKCLREKNVASKCNRKLKSPHRKHHAATVPSQSQHAPGLWILKLPILKTLSALYYWWHISINAVKYFSLFIIIKWSFVSRCYINKNSLTYTQVNTIYCFRWTERESIKTLGRKGVYDWHERQTWCSILSLHVNRKSSSWCTDTSNYNHMTLLTSAYIRRWRTPLWRQERNQFQEA